MIEQKIKAKIICSKDTTLTFETIVITDCELTENEQKGLVSKVVLTDDFKRVFPEPYEIEILFDQPIKCKKDE